jgi:hypothetical protein
MVAIGVSDEKVRRASSARTMLLVRRQESVLNMRRGIRGRSRPQRKEAER